MKKLRSALLSTVCCTLAFGISNYRINIYIHNSEIKQGSIIYEYISLSKELWIGIFVSVFIFLMFLIFRRTSKAIKSVFARSFIFSLCLYVFSYLLVVFTTVSNPSILWLSVFSVFIAAFTLSIAMHFFGKLIDRKDLQDNLL